MRPEKPSRAGILVLSHWPGVDEGTEHHCHALAAEGFTALAWDPFSAYDPGIDLKERRRLTRGPITDANARKEQQHWLGYMRQELGMERMGGIGFCMGGRQGLLLGAVDPRLECFSAFYPTLRMPVPEFALSAIDAAPEIRCPVQVHYPGLDEATSYDTFVALRSALETRLGPAATVAHYYREAVHGFMNDEHQSTPGSAIAKALAWPLTIAFFKAALKE